MDKKTVMIIEDYEVLLNAYTQLINSSEYYEVIGSFMNCEDTLRKIKKKKPDFLLLDITLPGMSGLDCLKNIYNVLPNTKIIIVSVHENSEHVFEALCAGAVGYLTKRSDGTKLIEALDLADAGGAPMSIKIAKMVVDSFNTNRFDDLTKKENEVLSLLAQGKSYEGISQELYVSVNTIKFHIRNIYDKLRVHTRDEAVALYKGKNKT